MAESGGSRKTSMKQRAKAAYGNAKATGGSLKRRTGRQIAAAKRNLAAAWRKAKSRVRGLVGKVSAAIGKRTGSKTAGKVYAKTVAPRSKGPAGMGSLPKRKAMKRTGR